MMFINSIFLPKTVPDQTMPEGISGKIGNFSHLFSNVFHIIKDEKESSLPFQSIGLNSGSVENPQNDLLKVSLFFDNKTTLENTNISMIVSAFLSKINNGELAEELVDTNKVKVNGKIPKYFSLSKDEFNKEIENRIAYKLKEELGIRFNICLEKNCFSGHKLKRIIDLRKK